MKDEAELENNGSWKAPPGSPFRSLTVQEVHDLCCMCNAITPSFKGQNNASWGQQHPVARRAWKYRGVEPKE